MLRRLAISCLMIALAFPVVARTRPHYGGVIRVEIEGDPWQRPGGLARELVFDGLTTLEPNGALSPALATDWKSENDNHRWQFRLRAGVHFHDGTPLTSVNVIASLNQACPSNCPWTTLHAVGSSVVFICDSPMPNLPWLLAGDDYRIALTVSGNGPTPPGGIGTGPFQVGGFNNGVLTLTANENCWKGRPFADSVELRVHRAIRDQWLDLSVDKADLVEVPAEQLRQAREQHLTLLASPPVSLLALSVTDSGALSNPNLRGAIAMAVDRGALSNVIFQKQGEVTGSLLPGALTGYAFLFPTERDLNKAHELRGGLATPPLTMTSEGGPVMQLAAQRIALNLHDAGFNVQVVAPGGPHPAELALRRVPLETNWPSAALESILRRVGTATPVNEDTPTGLYKTERAILDEHTIIPLLYLPRAWAVGARIRDLRLGCDGSPQLASASLEDAQ